MKLINLDNLVLVGPGSEWFWTAVSAVVVAVTFVAIYRQLRMQRSSVAIAQLDSIVREWDSEQTSRAWRDVHRAIESGADPGAFPRHAVTALASSWERIGYLTKMDHFDRKLVNWNLGSEARIAWERLRPAVLVARDGSGDPTLWADFEWLARTMAEVDAKQGIRTSMDADALRAANRRTLEYVMEALAAEEARRTVPVRIVEFSRGG